MCVCVCVCVCAGNCADSMDSLDSISHLSLSFIVLGKFARMYLMCAKIPSICSCIFLKEN